MELFGSVLAFFFGLLFALGGVGMIVCSIWFSFDLARLGENPFSYFDQFGAAWLGKRSELRSARALHWATLLMIFSWICGALGIIIRILAERL